MLNIKKGGLKRFLSFGGQGGFTLVELMVASVLSLVVAAGIYSVYRSQQRSYIVREQITLMQQNLRSGMVVMTDDIRMAGYKHPNITLGTPPGIKEANQNSLSFTQLQNKENNPEDIPANRFLDKISYSYDGTYLMRKIDLKDDGTVEHDQKIAENIDALDFVYIKDNGDEYNPASDPITSIKSVQVTMVARAGRADPDYIDTRVYKNQQGDTVYTPDANDHHRRRILSREIKCRNL